MFRGTEGLAEDTRWRRMDSRTLLSILWRRWFVVVPIAAAAVVTGVLVASSPNVRSETYGSELLVMRSQTGEQPAIPPSLSPDLLSRFVADSLSTPEFELALRDAGFASDFEVAASPESSIVAVTVTGVDEDDVFGMTETILDRAPAAMESLVGSEVASSIDLLPLAPASRDQIVEREGSFELSVLLTAWASTANVSNPLPVADSTLRTLGEIASRSELLDAVKDEVPSGSFSVSSEPRASAPIISIRASADEPTDVVRVYEVVRADLVQQLLDFQTSARVQPEDQTVLLQIVPPETIDQTRSSTVRAAASMVLLGLGLACLAAILIDLMVQRRQLRRSSRRLQQTPDSMSGTSSESDDERAPGSDLEPPMEAAFK